MIVLSEYGIVPVSTPIHVNRALRAGRAPRRARRRRRRTARHAASRAFAVADHQIAHIYVAEPSWCREVRSDRRGAAGRRAACSTAPSSGRSASTTRARASSSRSPGRTPGSPITTGSTIGSARLRAHGRDPSQARLRPGRAVPRSGDPLAQARDRLTARQACARLPGADGRDPARCDPGEGLPRPRHR